MADKAQNGKETNTEEPEYEVLEVGDDGKPLAPVDQHNGAEVDDDEVGGEHEDDDSEDEERLGHAEGDQEVDPAEQTRRRRSVENRAKRRRHNRDRHLQDQRIESLVQTMVGLQQRLAQAEGRSQQVSTQTIQGQIAQIDGLLAEARRTYETCLTNQDFAAASEVHDTQFELREQKRFLSAQLQQARRQQQPQAQQPQQRQQQQAQLDPSVLARAEAFADDHSWYDPSGADEDSAAVLRLDNELVAEGFDPRSRDYWKELRTRVKEELPHHFGGRRAAPNNGSQQRTDDGATTTTTTARVRGPRMAAPSQSGGNRRPLAKNQVRVTPARKQAMIEAGKWDDPVLRNKQLAAYDRYDREQAARTGR